MLRVIVCYDCMPSRLCDLHTLNAIDPLKICRSTASSFIRYVLFLDALGDLCKKIDVDIHYVLEIYAQFRHREVENKTAEDGL